MELTKSINLPIVRITLSALIDPSTTTLARGTAADRFRVQVSHLYPIERLALRDDVADLLDEVRKDLRVGVAPAHSVGGLTTAWALLD